MQRESGIRWCYYGCGFHCKTLKQLEDHAVDVHGAMPEQFKPQQEGRQADMFKDGDKGNASR